MSRTDYWHDPEAPLANSLVPSVTTAVRNDRLELLLIHKIDNDYWALPGGGMDLGESVTDAAIRETLEEAGIRIAITGLIGIYTDPGHVMAYSDGEVRQEFSMCFHARPISNQRPREDKTETRAAKWVPVSQVTDLNIHPSMRLRIDHALAQRTQPYLGELPDVLRSA